jgi:hypothetical protein
VSSLASISLINETSFIFLIAFKVKYYFKELSTFLGASTNRIMCLFGVEANCRVHLLFGFATRGRTSISKNPIVVDTWVNLYSLAIEIG